MAFRITHEHSAAAAHAVLTFAEATSQVRWHRLPHIFPISRFERGRGEMPPHRAREVFYEDTR
jgi:hypothetical protein